MPILLAFANAPPGLWRVARRFFGAAAEDGTPSARRDLIRLAVEAGRKAARRGA